MAADAHGNLSGTPYDELTDSLRWGQKFHSLLQRYPDGLLVAVDCHG